MTTEVPFFGTDSVRWIELTVPLASAVASFSSAEDANHRDQEVTFAPPPEDHASCLNVIGYNLPHTLFFWRINKSLPHAVELLRIPTDQEFRCRVGLRIIFPDALSPVACLAHNYNDSYLMELEDLRGDRPQSHPYVLCALTVSGVAYLVQLKDLDSYDHSLVPVLPEHRTMTVDLRTYVKDGRITCCAAATSVTSHLLIGTNLGKIMSFALGFELPHMPDFCNEFQEKPGIGQLWGWLSRDENRAVQDIVIRDESHAFVLHADGTLRVLEIRPFRQLTKYRLRFASSQVMYKRLWVDHRGSKCPLAILHTLDKESTMESISICEYVSNYRYSYHCINPPVRNILLEGGCMDVQFSKDKKILILKSDGLMVYKSDHVEEPEFYPMLEDFVADQLYQSCENFRDPLLLIAQSLHFIDEDRTNAILSSIFLRKLLHPGVFHSGVLQMTLQDYQRHLTASQLHDLTVDGLKKEILSVIELTNQNPLSVLDNWKVFFDRYYDNWLKTNTPQHLFVQSNGAIVLIRQSSVSLFRSMENIEHLVTGSCEVGDIINLKLRSFGDEFGYKILYEVLRIVNCISEQLEYTASAVIYELLISAPKISCDDFLLCLVKTMRNGYTSKFAASCELNALDTQRINKNDVQISLSLRNLSNELTTSWSRVLDFIEYYIMCLVPEMTMESFYYKEELDEYPFAILFPSTSQIAGVMFESATNILVFLSYLLQRQILPCDEADRVRFKMIPTLHKIVLKWLIIHFFTSTVEFCNQLSSMIITDFKALDDITYNYGLPDPQCILRAARHFISWIMSERTLEESSAYLTYLTELARILFRHGQYNSTELFIGLVQSHLDKDVCQNLLDAKGECYILHHLLGCTLLAQARESHGTLKETKANNAARCFFRASSGKIQDFQNLYAESEIPTLGILADESLAARKLHYFEWIIKTFKQHGISEGAIQFGHAALELVDEALRDEDAPMESATAIKGRLWANVFKFAIDLNHYTDAYSAIISNPNEESKYICLYHFINAVYEHGAIKVLCNGELPFIGLVERVELELFSKAECSHILVNPSPYKLLYAFEAHRHNWRKAASYMYRYTFRLRNASDIKDSPKASFAIQERLNGLCVAVNALNLVNPAYACFDPLGKVDGLQHDDYLGIEELEKELLLTSAECLLHANNIKWTYSNASSLPSDLIDLLIRLELYDMIFAVLLKFCKDAVLRREFESVFRVMSLKCCTNTNGSTSTWDAGLPARENNWQNLKIYLDKYKCVDTRLPRIVFETIGKHSDAKIPDWLELMINDTGRVNDGLSH